MAAKNSQILRTVPLILIVMLLCPITYGSIIYVDDDASDWNLGTSWLDAVNSLQDALLLSYFYEKPVEIHVAGGTYTPDQGLGITPGNQNASFELINQVTIKGGYAGLSDSSADTRDIVLYETILSGDLEQNDGLVSNDTSENSYHVVKSDRTDQTAVLDGVTISAGSGPVGMESGGGFHNLGGSPVLINCTFRRNIGYYGIGMCNYFGSPTLINCAFIENSTDGNGGGMYNSDSKPNLLNCTFTANSANAAGAGRTNRGKGGAIYNYDSESILNNCTFNENSATEGGAIYNNDSEPILNNCTFNENSATEGGAIYNYDSLSMLSDCHFVGNSADDNGGAVYNYSGTLTFLNCTFKENSASDDGGAIFNNSSLGCCVSMTNCILSGNSAHYGGAIRNGRTTGGGMIRASISSITTDYSPSAVFLLNCTLSANFARARDGGGAISSDIQHLFIIDEDTGMHNGTTLVNCILWGNTPDEIHVYEGEGDVSEFVVVFYSDVRGGFPGQGNIDVDPLFADPDNDDYHLKSEVGRWNPAGQCWVIDQVSSLCIDRGDPTTPVGLERFPNGGIINMGAYGGTPEASLSPPEQYPLPKQASNPGPVDKATSVDVNTTLTWDAGSDAVLHNVYFGTVLDDVKLSNIDFPGDVLVSVNQRGTSFYPGILDRRQTYYWRVDEVDDQGAIVSGVVWSFTTIGPVKGRACFTSETGVWSDGKLVPISKVAQGRSMNVIDCIKTVEEVQEHQGTFILYDVLLDSGKSITVAENHYFMAESGRWVCLQDLITNRILPSGKARLKTSKGSVGIESINKRPMPYVGKVYNLKIHGSDRYLIGEDAIIVRDY